jgi:hypothetical protein
MNRKAEKRILITGNGFDLALGLPTSYSNFITAIQYVQKSKDGLVFLQDISPNNYDKLAEHYKLQTSYDLNKIKETQYAQNLWLRYFVGLKPNPDKKWVDFEKEIHQILLDLKKLQKEIDLVEMESKCAHVRIYKGSQRELSGCVYIDERIFSRISSLLGLDSNGDSIDIVNGPYKSTFGIIEHLYKQLVEFSEIFKYYLTNLVMKIFDTKKFSTIQINAERIITFNYTPVAQALGIHCEHVHGDLSQSLIFGIDNANDLTQTFGSDVLSFTKYFQTIFYRTYASQFKQKIKETPAPPNHYIFYGHSFDLSDKSYIEPIFTAVHGNDNQQITICYDKDERRPPILRNLLDPRMLGNNANELIEELVAKDKLNFEHIESIIPRSH